MAIADVPDCWSLTSIASILLSLTAFDMKLVVDFFLVLFQTGQDVDAYRLVAVILSISPHFISATSLVSNCHNLISMKYPTGFLFRSPQ